MPRDTPTPSSLEGPNPPKPEPIGNSLIKIAAEASDMVVDGQEILEQVNNNEVNLVNVDLQPTNRKEEVGVVMGSMVKVSDVFTHYGISQ